MRELSNARRRCRAAALLLLLAGVTALLPIGTSAATISGSSGAFAGFAASPTGGGYWTVASGGAVTAGGSAKNYGDARNIALVSRIVGIAPTPTGRGYWLVAADGGIFSFGNAHFYGSMGGRPLSRPVVGITATPTGRGYWMFASDGGIFSFGDARFRGSTGGIHLVSPIVGMTPRPDGRGYWLVARDGGVFAFNARFFGSTGAMRLNSPIVGMLATRTGKGYWLVAADGGVFSFGDAKFYGSTGNFTFPPRIVGIAARAQHLAGYIIVASNGSKYVFGPGVKPPVQTPPPGNPGPGNPGPGATTTLPPGSALPSDATCAARVKPVAEQRPSNVPFNMTKGHQKNLTQPFAYVGRVDGNYAGTTDEIIQWTACKWGIDVNIARAQAAKESWWDQQNVGDFQSSAAECLPGHPIGADGHAGQCPGSGGLLSVRSSINASAFPEAMQSTAYNADYSYAFWRACYEGKMTWLNTVERVGTYAAGDVWGCLGVWFAGRWHTAAAEGYITAVKQWDVDRIWTQPDFQHYVH